MKDPAAARDYPPREEERRIREIRQIVLTSVDNVPVRVDDVVEGGPLPADDELRQAGRGRRPPDRGWAAMVSRAAARTTPARKSLDERRRPPMGRRRRHGAGRSCCCAKAKTRCRRCRTSRRWSRN